MNLVAIQLVPEHNKDYTLCEKTTLWFFAFSLRWCTLTKLKLFKPTFSICSSVVEENNEVGGKTRK